jgi:outer membrane beta-barrel protein
MKNIFLMAVLLVYGLTVYAAEEIEVPDDELAKESVLPVFDNTVSVRNRNVMMSGRFDVGVFGGVALTEPIASTTKFGFEVNYHLNEDHSVGGFYALNTTGLSKDAQGLLNDFRLDFSRAPKLKNYMMLDYNYSPFYGKLSFSKNFVMNTTIFGSCSLGLVQYEHKSYPALALGLGERFYFGKQLSLKVDFRFFAHQAPIPFQEGAIRDTDPVPALSSFKERLTYTSNLQLGLNYLF